MHFLHAWRAALATVLLLAPAATAQQDAPPAPPRVAVTLSGGAARGLSHIGVLETLLDAGIPIDLIVGTSAGALVGGLYAAGYSAPTIERIVTELPDDLDALLRVSFPPIQGLLDPTGFEIVYRSLVNDASLESTSPPLAVMVTELRPAAPAALTRGNLTDAVRASISIPLVFPPARVGDRYYVDGGLRDPVPVDIAHRLGGDVVLSLRSSSSPKDRPATLVDTLSLTVNAVTTPVEQLPPDYSLRVNVDDNQYFDFESAVNLIQRGRDTARAALPDLLALLAARGVPLNERGDPHAANPINREWRERLQRGLALARARPRPLEVRPELSLGPSAYRWGTEPGAPPAYAAFSAGAAVGGGPLGPLTVAAGLVKPVNAPGVSGYARVEITPPIPVVVTAELGPARRPAGAAWSVSFEYRGGPWTARATVDARTVGVGATVHAGADAAPGIRVDARGEARAAFTGGWRLEGAALLSWAPARDAWTVHARVLGALATGDAPGVALGASSGLRAFPDASVVTDRAWIANLEFGYRVPGLNLFGVATVAPELRGFIDAGFAAPGTLWDVGVGVSADARLFGFLPFTIGVDVAIAPATGAWRANVFSTALLR